MGENKITIEQFQGIWRILRAQVPMGLPSDESLIALRMDETFERLSHLSYRDVADAAASYIEAGERAFPTWGNLIDRVRQKKQSEPARATWNDEPHPAVSIANKAPRSLIDTPEWRSLAKTMDLDPTLMFDNWDEAKRERSRRKAGRKTGLGEQEPKGKPQ